MQKLMFKGLMKDEKTLKELNVTSGSKLMLIGSTPKAVLEVTKPVVAGPSTDSDEKGNTCKSVMLLLNLSVDLNPPNIFDLWKGCCGSVDKTTDSQSWGPRFKCGSGSIALWQGTLSSLPSPSERT